MTKKCLLFVVLGMICFAGCNDDDAVETPEGLAACGNQKVETGEACDDGNTTGGDGCSADCAAIEDGYQCPTEGGACTKIEENNKPPEENTDPKCGDGKVESGEVCDDSNTDAGDGCSADCKTIETGYDCPSEGGACTEHPVVKCGNGDLDDDEVCDDGNTADGDGCSADCKTIEENYICPITGSECIPAGCGNGETEENEECDAGDMAVNYGKNECTSSCKRAHYCGDGLWDDIDRENGEECDAGADTSGEYGGCTSECKLVNFCGDGQLQTENEKCDDGNTDDGDGCSASCEMEANYVCVTTDGKSVCTSILCGNGQLDGAETCDDGNRAPNDGCSQLCQTERLWKCTLDENGKSVCENTCGNKKLDTDTGEVCDDGDTDDGDGCSSACSVENGYICDENSCHARACGDGIVAGNEECDDGNTTSEDGCSKFCKREFGWHCDTQGQKCEKDVCGDGKITGDETCDEGSKQLTDGCKDCQVQKGWKCPTGGTACEKTTCGDDIVEGAEACEGTDADGCCVDCELQNACHCDSNKKNCAKGKCGDGFLDVGEECDDNNLTAGDGCSPICTMEPIFDCVGNVCKPICGDGLTMWESGEECDDGNLVNGDGCSSDCKIESGYTCTKFNGNPPDVLNLPIVYRDFRAYHPGFTNDEDHGYPATLYPDKPGYLSENVFNALPATCKEGGTTYRKRHFPKAGTPIPDFQGNSCYSWNYCANVVYPVLDATGRPKLRPANEITKSPDVTPNYDDYETCAQLYTCPELFDYWYKDSDMSITIATTLPLNKQADGAYQYTSKSFWPLKGKGYQAADAETLYGRAEEREGLFTSEFQSYFKYQGGEVFTFSGDDDVWVYFNGKLAMELAGIHGDWRKSITLTAEEAKKYDMYPGGIYPMKMFHAERCNGGSTFTLTLAGFINMGTSECNTVCGDGIVRGSEECDYTGINTDEKLQHDKGCSADCKLQPFCGNGKIEKGEQCDSEEAWCVDCKLPNCGNNVLDEHEECDGDKGLSAGQTCLENCRIAGCGDGTVGEGEECDDGNTSDDDMCTSKCTLPRCGDGIISKAIGEVCDDGEEKNTGAYGACGFDCTYIPPRCGDGVLDALNGEECDSGTDKNVGGYGACKEDCKLDIRCGDGILQPEFEQCDDGEKNGDDNACTTSCTTRVN